MERLGYKPEDFKLRVGMFGSEASSDEMHAEIARKLHILPTDNYGLSELIGPGVSGECELKRGMHINEDHFYAELLDPETFEPQEMEGEYGELVLTALTKRSHAHDPLPHQGHNRAGLLALRMRPHDGAHGQAPRAARTTCSSSRA